MDNEQFPYQLTEFIEKVNARYDGDPQGDYVMAEHINEVQDAIQRIEQALGVRSFGEASIEERLERLSRFKPLSVPKAGYFDRLDGTEGEHQQDVLNQYPLLILTDTKDVPAGKKKGRTIFGRVDANSNLETIQSNIHSWKQQGATGIYLDGLEKDNRTEKIEIVQSVSQEGLELMVAGDVQKLLDNTPNPYNYTGEAIPFPEGTLFVLKDFGYTDRLVQADVVMSQLLPKVRLIKQNGHQVIGFSDTRTKESFNGVHTLALLLSLDYMYWGPASGATVNQPPYTYNWNLMMSDWRTDAPNLFLEDGTLYRYVVNGRIELQPDGKPSFPGLESTSDGIDWLKETIPGDALQVGSIPADRLATYDIQKIVDLINEAPENIRIDPTKIDSDNENVLLPENIPASHMIQNVIEAINRKNNPSTSEFQYIENTAIKSLDAKKLDGSVAIEQLLENTIRAINQSSMPYDENGALHIDVPYAEITNLKGLGQLDYAQIIGSTGTFASANVTNTLTTFDIENNNLITSPRAEISEIKADRIEVARLEGLESLYVPHLEADNMEALVIESIEAKIARGEFDSIVTSTLESSVVISEIIKSTTNFAELTSTDKARIESLIADTVSANYAFINDLDAGIINTDKMQITSDTGLLRVEGDSLKVYSYPDENNERHLRVLIGHLEEATGNAEDYGFVALSQDGKTRIFDHTGVYEGGIHKDAVTEETIQDGAVGGNKIQYDAISVDHLQGGTITGDWIDGQTITGDHIVGETITADHLQALSIDSHHLNGAIIEGTHIKGHVIEGEHIKANAIGAEQLNISFGVNLIKQGLDSFEQYNTGEVNISDLNTGVRTTIENLYALEGDKTLRVMSLESNVRLHIGRRIMVDADKRIGISAFIRIPQGMPNERIALGAYLTDGTDGEYITGPFQSVRNLYSRYRYIVEDMKGYHFVVPTVTFENSNATILVDAIQVEELEPGEEISPWKTTATTVISGDNIQTGRVDASHIKIGSGTIFGDGDIIDITDGGISVRSDNGDVLLSSQGLEIDGGAFHLISGVLGEKSFQIADGKLVAETPLNLIELDPDHGFRIISKQNEQILFDTDPETGDIRMSGTFRVYSKDNPAMSWTVEDRLEELQDDIEQIELTPGPDGKGLDGDNAVVGFLDNESHTVATNANGDDGDYTGAHATLYIYNGTKDDTANWKVTVTHEDGIRGRQEDTTYYVDYTPFDTSEILFKAERDGFSNITKTFTLTKAKQGVSGVIYSLTTDNTVLKKDAITGNISPKGIKVKGSKGTGDLDDVEDGYGYFVVYEQSENHGTVDEYMALVEGEKLEEGREYVLSDTDNPYVLRYLSEQPETRLEYTIQGNPLSVRIDWFKDEDLTVLLDQTSVIITTDWQPAIDEVQEDVDQKAEQNLVESIQAEATLQVGMKVGYSGFNTRNANSVYLCGIEYSPKLGGMMLVDRPGSIYIKSEQKSFPIKNQALPATGIPANTTAYIIYDRVKQEVYYIYFESKMTSDGVEIKRWRDIPGNTIELIDSHFAIGEIET